MFLVIEKAANSVGLNVNGSKAKLMILSRNLQRHNYLEIEVLLGTWSFKTLDEQLLLDFERNIMRMIYGL